MKHQPVLYILRGVPGSGKSTQVKEIERTRQKIAGVVQVFSADHHFIGSDGVYRFDPSQIGTAHRRCKDGAALAMCNRVGTVVVDNTNTQEWEFKPYLEFAEQYGYEVRVLRMACRDEEQAREFAARNSHGVPVESVLKMFHRFEDYDGETLIK